MAEKPPAWRRPFRRRLALTAAVVAVWAAFIEGRLVHLQVVQHADLSARAERQQSRTVTLAGQRGEILDRRGNVLALSVDAVTIYADPAEITDPAGTAAALCKALGDCSTAERRDLAERLGRDRRFEYVRRQGSPEQARTVSALQLPGIGFMKEERRYYPNRELAAHLLGYVGIDNTGLGGLEAAYDAQIQGRQGTVLIQTDARRQGFSRVERPPTTGATLELTIDTYLQHIAERELRAGIARSRAAAGSVVVLDPYTGEILALANYPTFNPNVYREARGDARRNRAVQDLYEPGSTFKIVTAGAALEEGVVRPDERIDVSAGEIRFGSRVIRDDTRHDTLTFEDVLVESSNVGAVKVGLRLGAERLDRYVRRFGFGRPLSPDFRGESAGIVWAPERLNDSALASVAFGHQVAVTPLQMAAAIGAVANGGELVEPRVVRAIVEDGVRTPVPPRVLGRAISPATAAQLTTILEAVVERGSAQRAQVAGFTAAGKTGTARKLVNGGYSRTDYNVSFAGFVPSRHPVFAIMVIIDTPRGVSPYGGVVAAPVFQKIAEASLLHYGVAPTGRTTPLLVGGADASQDRPASAILDGGAAASPVRATGDTDVVPDLAGLSARDAVRVLSWLGIAPRLHGDGVVVRQRPAPGTPLDAATLATLWLERLPVPGARPATP